MLCLWIGKDHNIFFFKQEPVKKIWIESPNAIAYALSSGKCQFAFLLAEKLLEFGRKITGLIELYCFSLSTLFFSRKISELFSVKLEKSTQNYNLDNAQNKLQTSGNQTFANNGKYNGINQAKKILSVPEFADFFRVSDDQEIKSCWEAIENYRKNFNKK